MAGEYQGKRPGEVNLRSGNIQASWERFKQKFGFFMIAIGQDKATAKVKFAHLMGEAGEDAIEVYNSFSDKLIKYKKDAEGNNVVDQDLSQDYDSVIALFDQYAAEKKCVTACRERFNARNQRVAESFSQWLTDLRNLVKQCEYSTVEDSMLKDRIIWGARDKRLKEQLRAKSNLSLQDIIDVCKAFEATNRHEGNEVALEVASIQSRASHSNGQYSSHQNKETSRGHWGASKGRAKGNRAQPYAKPARNQNGPYRNEAPATYKCRKCTNVHAARQCPAWGHECTKCGEMNHYEVVCDGKPWQKKNNFRPAKSVHQLEEVNTSEEESLLEEEPHMQSKASQVRYVHMLTITSDGIITSGESANPRKEYTEVVQLQGEHLVKFKLDGGSEVNILPYEVFILINRNYSVKPSPIRLSSYGKFITSPYGQVDLLVETHHGDKKVYPFQISKIDDRPILGNVACEELNLVRRVKHPEQRIHLVNKVPLVLPATKELLLEQYSTLFTGLGEFTTKVHIKINPNVQPEMCPPRRYHFSLVDKLKAKIDSLVQRGIVAPIKNNEVPTFVSNLVVREKGDGDLRICLDPEKLNKAIVRQKYIIPTVEEIAHKVKDKAIFTVLDLKEGFWHATLDAASSSLCAFSTPFGLYKFLKMPFGLSCAPEIFQFYNEQVFKGTSAQIYIDDCLITGKDLQEHDRELARVLERAKEQNIRFNPAKIQYRQTEVKFLGQLWSKNQIRVDPERVRALEAIKEPTKKKELQRCLGMFNYLRNFIPQMAQIAAPLYQLLSGSVTFHWLPQHADAFKSLKDSVGSSPVLATFDSTKPSVIQADASQYGLGCCLLQGNQPVAFHSRVLTETEKQYAQIEKEMLALVFASLKFEKYIYGLDNVVFQTDHQPLVSIFKKPIAVITNNRLKKFRLKMLQFQPQVEYLPGKYLYMADLLSRQCLSDPVEDDPEMIEVVHEVTMYISMEPEERAEYLKETGKDLGLQGVMRYIQEGWPLDRKLVLPEARPYWQMRNDLFVEDGLIVLGDRIVVPEALRRKALATLHKAHLGIEKIKAKGRQTLYWPAMSNDITVMTQECRICERNAPAKKKEPLIPHEIPRYPFQKVSVDIMELSSTNYLVIVDNLSKWLDIKKLSNKSSASVIGALRQVFSVHGIPEIIFGDNNPLNSRECHEYAREIGSKIVTSSPEYPRSNGLAEKGVHIAKQLMTKSGEANIHYLDALLEYNNTPLSGMNVSPSQVLMSRTCRTSVPVLQRNLEPKITDVRAQLKRKQDTVKLYHDSHATVKVVEYQPGDKVSIFRNNKWCKGKVLRKHAAPRSYMVRTSGGSLLRRNTVHLKPSRTEPDYLDRTIAVDIEGLIVASGVNETVPLPETNLAIPVSTENNEGEHGMELEDGLPEGNLCGPNPSEEAEPTVSSGKRSRSGRHLKKPVKYGYDD